MAEKKAATEDVAVTDVIAYVGTSNWRAITESDWLVVGVKGTDHLWSEDNKHEIAVSAFVADEIKWLLADEDFVKRHATPDKVAAVDETPDPAQHA